MIRQCSSPELETIRSIINTASEAYRGVIPADCWHEPYMPLEELAREVAAGVTFYGFYEHDRLVAVMGLQCAGDVALIRHAYTLADMQGKGLGTGLLACLRSRTNLPMLVGTWRAATWAVRFYESRGFMVVTREDKDILLRGYWTIPPSQIDESVVLADARWFARRKGGT